MNRLPRAQDVPVEVPHGRGTWSLFSHIDPTDMLRRLMPLEPLDDAAEASDFGGMLGVSACRAPAAPWLDQCVAPAARLGPGLADVILHSRLFRGHDASPGSPATSIQDFAAETVTARGKRK